MRVVSTIALVCWAAALAPPTWAEPQHKVEVVRGSLAYQIDTELTEAAAHGFNGAVIVEQRGEAVLKAGYGLANRDTGAPFTAETVAQIGSITKPLTALAVLQLAARRKLDLDAKVKTYLPLAAEPTASATLRQLLTHTAGLADSCGDDFDKVSTGDLEGRCMAKPLLHPAGTYSYSNMGYSVLAAVVEEVSHQDWDVYLSDHIFRPLGMEHTGFLFHNVNTSSFAVGYLDDAPQPQMSARLATLGGRDWNLRGNGGVQASATDMERFYRALSGHASGIPRALADRMTKPQVPIDQEAWQAYGLAVRKDVRGNVYRIGHSGSDGVFFSYFGWYPDEDIFIYIVGSNGEKAAKPVIAKVIADIQSYAGVLPKNGK